MLSDEFLSWNRCHLPTLINSLHSSKFPLLCLVYVLRISKVLVVSNLTGLDPSLFLTNHRLCSSGEYTDSYGTNSQRTLVKNVRIIGFTGETKGSAASGIAQACGDTERESAQWARKGVGIRRRDHRNGYFWRWGRLGRIKRAFEDILRVHQLSLCSSILCQAHGRHNPVWPPWFPARPPQSGPSFLLHREYKYIMRYTMFQWRLAIRTNLWK